jgi:hypothetical protein
MTRLEYRDRAKAKNGGRLKVNLPDQRYPASLVVEFVPLSSVRGCLTIESCLLRSRGNSIGTPRNWNLSIGKDRRRKTGGNSSVCNY